MYNQSNRFNFVPISDELTEFEKKLSKLELIRYIEHPELFYKEAAYFKKVDEKDSYYYLFSKIKSNDFNKGSGYLTHGFDFYKGSFHGQMIRGLINYCNLKGDSIILDPFCGSGTTLVESNLLGFNSIGIDINPIACLNSKIKTNLLNCNVNRLSNDNKKYFKLGYYDKYKVHLTDFTDVLKSDIKELFYLFIFLRAISIEFRFSTDRKIGFKNIYYKLINVLKSFENLKKEININLGESSILFGDCLIELKNLKSNSIDAIITSPPYIDLIDYIQEDLTPINYLIKKEKIEFLKSKSIGNKFRNYSLTEKLYWNKIDLFLKELIRILKPNKNFILIVNNYKNMSEKFEEILIANYFLIERILKRVVVNIKKKNNTEFVYFLKSKI